MRLYKGTRRWLIAILMALALGFASAGCTPPHVKVPYVPEQVHDFYDVGKNIKKHKNVEEVQHICLDEQGLPFSDDC